MTDKPRRVLLVFPVFTHVYPVAFENFLRLVNVGSRLLPNIIFDPWVIPRRSIHGAMNMAVDTALENGHWALIAFDDDCLPVLCDYPIGDPKRFQVLPRLLHLLEYNPIVAGTGYMRDFPHTTTVGKHYDHGMSMVVGKHEVTGEEELTVKGFHWVEDVDSPEWKAKQDENGLLDVDFCGVPIIGIRYDVLHKVPKPLFETRDHIGRGSTHDIYFCNKAKAHGFPIKVDTRIDCGHIIDAPIVSRTSKRLIADTMKAIHKEEIRGKEEVGAKAG